MKKMLIVTVIILIVLVFAIFYVSQNNTEKKKIMIGFIAPLTGPLPECGLSMEIGKEMAKEMYGRPDIEFIVEDDQFNPTNSVTIARKLIEQDNVSAIIGPCQSSSVLAVAPVAEASKTVMITPTGFADRISEAGDYIFRSATRASDEAPYVAGFISKNLDRNVGIIYLNNDFGLSYKNRMQNISNEYEIRIILSESADPPVRDFRTVLAKMNQRGVKTIIIASTPLHAIEVVNQATELGLNFAYVGAGTNEDEQFVTGTANNSMMEFYVISIVNFMNNDESKKFEEIFSKKYPGKISGRDRIQTFISTSLVLEATEKCVTDKECVKNYLYEIKNKPTIIGNISIDSYGDVKYSDFVIKKLVNGKFVKAL